MCFKFGAVEQQWMQCGPLGEAWEEQVTALQTSTCSYKLLYASSCDPAPAE